MSKEKIMSELIDLWSVQGVIPYQNFLAEKVLRFHPDPAFPFNMDVSGLTEDELDNVPQYIEVREEYMYMREQCCARLKGYKGNLPIWAWPERPPLPEYGFISGEQLYCFHFRVPRDRVLFSSFHAWCVIYHSKAYVALCEKEAKAFDKWVSVCDILPDRDNTRKIIANVIRQSWDRIFDVELLAKYKNYWGPKTDVQGVLEEVFADEVVEIEPFVSVSMLEDDD